MHPIVAKTFGGLSARYYIRQFLFGLGFPIFICMMLAQGAGMPDASVLAMFAVNSILYPYSRFAYESLVSYIVGENVFIGSAVLVLGVKLMTMMVCWVLAIFIAPIGLAYLYFYHSRIAR